jgi:4'-phosphopantetheinyl transferase
MTTLYFTDCNNLYAKVTKICSQSTTASTVILKTQSGKPYIKGNPIFFNISHSGEVGVIAISDSPIGVDCEILKGKNHEKVTVHYSKNELKEIVDERTFLLNWTAKEAFIKMLGATLSQYFKRLTFFGGDIYLDGCKQQAKIKFYCDDKKVVAICNEDENFNIQNI